MKQITKEFLKNMVAWVAAIGLIFAAAAFFGIGVACISLRIGITTQAVSAAIMAAGVVGAAIQTAREARKHRKAAKAVSVLLEDAITSYKNMLAAIDAEPPGGGKAARRAVCKITLVALEEKRDRIIREYGRRKK